jgi:glycerophosphoryl diester phosphodiesterase
MNRFPLLLYGHRGAARERPENTLPSFERALEAGVDVLETDVQITRDGHLVLAHDDTGARMANVPVRLRRATLTEVASWDAGWGFLAPDGSRPFAGVGVRIPTLERTLAEFPDVPMNIDIKDSRPAVVDRLLSLLERMGAAERVRLASFSLRVISRVRRRGYAGETSLSRPEAALALALPAAALRRLPGLGSAAQIPDRAAGQDLGRTGLIDKLHRAGLRVDFWTINEPRRAAELLACGADGIVTDDPAALRPVFDEARGAL